MAEAVSSSFATGFTTSDTARMESLLLSKEHPTYETNCASRCCSRTPAALSASKRSREDGVSAVSRCSPKVSCSSSPHSTACRGPSSPRVQTQPSKLCYDTDSQAPTCGSPDSIRSTTSYADLLFKRSASFGLDESPSAPSSPASVTVASSHDRATSFLSEPETEYLRYLTASEVVHRSNLDLTTVPANGRRNITTDMRSVLVSWMSEVCQQFQLHQETFFLSISLLDRYLGRHQDVPRARFQMLGTCCILLAAKHEEVTYPSTEQFVAISDNCFSRQQLLACEINVLEALDHRINVPTPYTLLLMFERALWPTAAGMEKSPARQGSRQLVALAVYLLELSALDYGMQSHLPSVVAAAALAAAGQILKQPVRPGETFFLQSTCAQGLANATSAILSLHADAAEVVEEDVDSPVLAVKEKYCTAAWCRASTL